MDLKLLLTNMDDTETSSSSSPSSEDDIEVINLLQHGRRNSQPKIKLFVENVVSQFSNNEFKRHFRLSIQTFETILNLIGPEISKTAIVYGNKPICAKKQLLISLWYLGTPDSYRSVSLKFDVGRATALRSVRRVTKALYIKAKNIIKWPTPEEMENTANSFNWGFPGIIGAIDGCHIKINAPKYDAISYVNRKGYHSILLQGVCDNNLKFISTFAGPVGSVHDARMLNNSPLMNKFNDPERFFPNNKHIIGDSAYPINPYLMVPYKNYGNLNQRKKNFNFCLSSNRMVIEKAFGLLKSRFRSLLHCLPMTKIAKIPEYIIACCVLHNICIDMDDFIDVENVLIENDDIGNNFNNNDLRNQGNLKRDAIAQQLQIVIN